MRPCCGLFKICLSWLDAMKSRAGSLLDQVETSSRHRIPTYVQSLWPIRRRGITCRAPYPATEGESHAGRHSSRRTCSQHLPSQHSCQLLVLSCTRKLGAQHYILLWVVLSQTWKPCLSLGPQGFAGGPCCCRMCVPEPCLLTAPDAESAQHGHILSAADIRIRQYRSIS